MKKKCASLYSEVYKNMSQGISVVAAVFVLATLASFFFVQWAGDIMFKNYNPKINAGYGLGLIIPLCTIMSFIITHIVRTAYKNVTPLLHGLEKVAQGDYSVRIPMPEKKYQRFMSSVNDTFNKMVTELENTSILRTDFINGYSHEFKTPIASINGFANLMLRQDVTEEERKQYLQIIADESKRLADLANDTLLLSKLDSVQIITDRQPYSLDEQLRKCVIMLSKGWNDKHITFSGDMAEVTYTGNAEIMQHLWLNILNNAIKFTPEGGEVSVVLVKQDTNAVISIADNGIGMDDETLSHIFEKYYQGPSEKRLNGLGFGLSLAHRIVELCGGTITVKSKLNEGSTFTVTLPLS